MPAMGPATAGLSGLLVLVTWQLTASRVPATTHKRLGTRRIVVPRRPGPGPDLLLLPRLYREIALHTLARARVPPARRGGSLLRWRVVSPHGSGPRRLSTCIQPSGPVPNR